MANLVTLFAAFVAAPLTLLLSLALVAGCARWVLRSRNASVGPASPQDD